LIIAKRAIDVYCVTTFERTYEDDAVQVIHLHNNGLDGKVSRIEIGTGWPIVPSAGPPEPSAVATPPTNTPVPTETPTSPPTIPSLTEAACVPTGTTREIATVTRIVDGDTIDVEIDGASFRVRYIGIDTPERGRPFFDEATGKNASLVEGRTVTLIKDVSETDRYDRLLRYVLVGSTFVNHQLVRDGYALAFTYPPDVACSKAFVEAQRQAASEGRGLWAATPTPYHTPQPPPTQSPCHPSYEGVCLKVGIGDYDCAGGSGNGPNYVEGPFRVVGYDEFELDRDGDGLACE
jgi:micrococcal nuclease